jgi:hypothetical protein
MKENRKRSLLNQAAMVCLCMLIPRFGGASTNVAAAASQAAAPPLTGPASSGQTSGSVAQSVGVSFVPGSNTTCIIERDGKRYLVDLSTHTVKEMDPSAAPVQAASTASQPGSPQAKTELASAPQSQEEKPEVYEPGDDKLFSLPTGRRLARHGLYFNFTHRFPYEPAFVGTSRGHVLIGLDDFSVSSFGLRFGVTDKFSVAAYRTPSVIGRTIELMAAYNLLDEHDSQPLNLSFRFSVDGQNDFQKNFSANIEGEVSRSITHRAQVYVVPTLSFQVRPLTSAPGDLTNPPPDLPGFNTFSIGAGGALDIRPTVALVAEVIPTLWNARELGIHRPAFAFGIQKKIWRHAFTFGFTNSPGTTVSDRAGTNASFLSSPSADIPSHVFVGFDLSRQVF